MKCKDRNRKSKHFVSSNWFNRDSKEGRNHKIPYKYSFSLHIYFTFVIPLNLYSITKVVSI